jgi:hypothetical protein
MPILGSIIKGAIELRSRVPVEFIKPEGIKAQRRVLRKLLRKAQYTSFGEHHRFGEILRSRDMVGAFQQNVPATAYNDIFKKWWYRTLNGEAYVCWPNRVKYFALSSGTSEASSKYIPVTNDMLRAIKKISIRQLISLANYDFPSDFYERGILMLGGSTHLHFNGTYYEGDLSGITASNIPFWFEHFYKPGKRIAKERDWQSKLNDIVKKAKDWDIGVVVGVPAWIQILMERIIEYYKLENIHQIWPNLSIYVHGGVSFEPYKKGFARLLGKPLTYIETYLASEGFLAYQTRPDTDSMQMVLDNNIFFEFVPFNSDNFDIEGNLIPNPQVLTIDQVEEGREYALLLSSCAGAWRYLIGDTLRFTSKELYEIQITGRTKHFLSLCGEHLSQENMNRAVRMLEDELNVDIREFTVSGIKYDTMFAHQWYLGSDDPIDQELAREKIDGYLKVLNDDYRVERIAALKDVLVDVLPTSWFYEYMKIHGKEGGQHKFPRVVKGDHYLRWIDFLKTKRGN